MNLIETQITVKVKLKLQSSETASNFAKTMELYRKACNFVSDYVFNHNFEFAQSCLNQALYTDMRKKIKIKSKMAQSAIQTVVARYKTVITKWLGSLIDIKM